jgi:hypothetical protein
MSEAMIKLQAKKESIDVGRVGLFSGIYTMMTDIDVRALEDAVSRYVIAEALIDNISNTEGGIVCREILVDQDLCDPVGNAITSRDWRQPPLSFTTNYTTNTGAKASQVQIYSTNTTISRNDRKVFGIYGLRLVGTGPAREHAILTTNSWIWKRSDVKTIDIWPIQTLETIDGQAIYGKTPILFKRGDDMAIWVIPNARTAVSTAKFDQLCIQAKVAEALGANVTG